MNKIAVLDEQTIDKIAAGEVIERPASIVKELVENAIDAGANAITVEIKDGGISFIRITDNGMGIEADQVKLAFMRHATSKIRKVDDLLDVTSLGFRGEALSSIAAVCQVELITKTTESLTGVRYLIEGGKEKGMEEIGAPSGTTFLVRNIFFNTPARKKFLKTAQTEAGYIGDIVERIALSHPEVAFKFISNNQTKLHTSGNHNLKDIIYNIYGRDIAGNLLSASSETESVHLSGFIGKPVISRGNRNYENYFVNGRYIRSSVISKAIEDAYHTFMMKHKYPFTVLHFQIDGNLLDINVHPTKMELRFSDNEEMYQFVYEAVKNALTHKEMVVQVEVGKEEKTKTPEHREVKKPVPEPFEVRRREAEMPKKTERTIPVLEEKVSKGPDYREVLSRETERSEIERQEVKQAETKPRQPVIKQTEPPGAEQICEAPAVYAEKPQQMNLFDDRLLSKENVKEHKIIGQLFDTYWLVEFRDKLFIIDQHAAHEKVMYERLIKSMENREYTSQNINPPIILTLNMTEEALLKKYMDRFTKIGFEIEEFGGKEYALRAVPDNLFGLADRDLFLEMLDSLGTQGENLTVETMDDRIATMSCKAAVKGNSKLSVSEIHALIDELLKLENPYNCPHGRPTIISMSKYELERKFKRII
ncbi:MAG: DNA mismatch repair endonuclease MutL [Eubacteriales bacterium]|nr:DNA mismatch repair endonuclease MutL [Eubacteriales bacterium]